MILLWQIAGDISSVFFKNGIINAILENMHCLYRKYLLTKKSNEKFIYYIFIFIIVFVDDGCFFLD